MPALSTFATRFFGPRHWHISTAAAFFLGTWVVLWLGDLAGANCFIITVKPWVEGADVKAVRLVHGYLSQSNHGFFYLLVVPTAICLAGVFLAQVRRSLRELKEQRRLTEKGYQWITAFNGKLKWVLYALIPVLIIMNLCRELPTIRQAEEETTTFHMGYIQVFSVEKWAKRLASDTAVWPTITSFDHQGLIQESVAKSFVNFPLGIKQAFWRAHAVDVPGFNPAQPPLPDETHFKNGGYTLDLGEAIKAGLLKLQISAARNRPNQSIQLQYFFTIAVQILEGSFHAIAIWLAIKMICLLYCIWKLLPGADDESPGIVPFCQDPTHRFGLAALHPVYNWILVILLLGAASFSLVFTSAGSMIPQDDTSYYNTLSTLSFIAVAVTAVMSVLAFGPMYLFHVKLHSRQRAEISEINKRIGRTGPNSHGKAELESELETLRKQSTWPKQEQLFTKALWATFVLTALPVILQLTTSSGSMPKEVESLKSLPDIVDASSKSLSLRFYRDAFAEKSK